MRSELEPAASSGQVPAQPGALAAEPSGAAGGTGRLAALVMRLQSEVEAAQSAAEGRAVIEMAKGLLMERLDCSAREADLQLRRLAEQAGLTPLEVAADLVQDSTVRPGPGPGPDTADAGGAARLRTAESAALAAHDCDAVAHSLLQHALGPLGAVAVALWASSPDGSITLAGTAGVTEQESHRWRHVPPRVTTLARLALSRREVLHARRLADVGAVSIAEADLADHGRVGVPAQVHGRTVGVLEVVWGSTPPVISASIAHQLESLGEVAGHALDVHEPLPTATLEAVYPQLRELSDLADGLDNAAALVLAPAIDRHSALTDFRIHHLNPRFADPAGRPRTALIGKGLLESYPLVGAPGGLFDAVEHVYATGEPFRAPLQISALVDGVPIHSRAQASLSRHGACVLVVWHVEAEASRLADLLQHAQRLGRIAGFEEDFRTGEITWNDQLFDLYGLRPGDKLVRLEDIATYVHGDDHHAVHRFLRTLLHHRRPSAAAFRLERADQVTRYIRIIAEPVLGPSNTLEGVRGAYQDISAQHWTEVALAATREQLAHTEAEARERNRLTLRLQQAIMPPAHAATGLPGLQIAVRYRPAEQEHLVGGDWYDALPLPGNRVLLSVGDVAGHGIEAATGMVALRNALRGLAATGAGPGQLLTWLNSVSHQLTDEITATAVCAIFDPGTRELRWARAGHLPPVLVRDHVPTPLPLTSGLLLGALPSATYEEHSLTLEPHDTLLMFTDGLIERRDTVLETALSELLTHLPQEATLEQLVDRLLVRSSSDTDDDTCLIAVNIT
nr:SpoIIE family protein phosphatase [Peterkaempfera griseoplana]